MSNKLTKKVPLVEVFGPTIQGEGAVIGQQTYFLRFGLCIAADQRVLMGDWTLKPISQICVGDYVIAADLRNRGNLYTVGENPTKKNTCLRPSEVLRVVNNGSKPVVKITSPSGSLITTADHEVFAYTRASTNGYWKRSDSLKGKSIRHVHVQSWTQEFSLGWLHGAFAGDGSIHKFQDSSWRMKLSCGDIEIVDKALNVLQSINAPNPHLIQHNPGNGKPILPGVEVTNHKWVESFRQSWLEGKDSTEYRRGWLAGFYDTDGSWTSTGIKASENSGHIWYWQNKVVNEWKYNRCLAYLTAEGFTFTIHDRAAVVGMNSEGNVGIYVNKSAAFFTACGGVLTRKKPLTLNIMWLPKVEVQSVENMDPQEVWDITTEHGNFIAEGVLVHNCDYKCTMCDSMHAVDPQRVKANAKWLTQEEIFEALQTHRESQGPHSTKWVTFSGGNPLIHDLDHLVQLLIADNWDIAVETQGTLYEDWVQACDVITVSPKGPGMGEQLEIDKLDAFMDHLRGHQGLNMKVVIFDERDLEVAAMLYERYLLADHHYFNKYHFYLSLGNPYPPGTPIDFASPDVLRHELLERYLSLLADVMKHPVLCNVKFLPQWHVLLWGNKQGV